jgi:citrate synthase
MAKDTLTIIDNRTGRQYEVPIDHGTIRTADLKEIRVSPDDPGLMGYDPAFTNTASCKSKITFIDGERGILRYRGYPIEELAEKSNYLETAYLIVKGELPDARHFEAWKRNITLHSMVHENIKKFVDEFRYDAHPMGILVGTIGALSTFYPDAKDIFDLESRRLQTRRLIGKLPTLAAFAYRHSRGLPYVYPDNDLSYTGNFLSMLLKMTELKYVPNPVLERALEVLFILHADHEQNCSTNALRCVASSQVDAYSAVAAAVAALYGPLHGGANESVIRMLMDIGSVARVPEAIKKFKAGEGRLMGFGHRVYKNYDPRAGGVFRVTQALSECRLLLRHHLPGDGFPPDHVPGAVRDSSHLRLDGAVGRDGARSRAEDRPPAPDLPGRRGAHLRADR